MRVIFATAELSPLVKVGGLGEAASGLVRALHRSGVEVEVALPDYEGSTPSEGRESMLGVPGWAGPARLRERSVEGIGRVRLVHTPTLPRPHPYTDSEGRGWPDNDTRFFSFSAGVAALVAADPPDVLHLNDWHTGATLGFLPDPPPTVLTIHNLAYQGWADGSWLGRLPHRPEAYEWYGGINPLTGAIALADRVVTVSPTFAAEARQPATGFGVHEQLAARGERFLGILNGIDTSIWDPSTDSHLPLHYDVDTASRKRELARRLARELGWEPNGGSLVGMVTRLTEQKGVDLALEATKALTRLGARMVLLGSGDREMADAARRTALSNDRFIFRQGHDEGLAHRIFAAADLYLMPSRFEPAGLAQMQAMRYGAIPVVTDVGGLHDTVTDADAHPGEGTGFVAARVEAGEVVDALDRAVRAWRSTRRRGEIRRRGMVGNWSWERAAESYHRLYREVSAAR